MATSNFGQTLYNKLFRPPLSQFIDHTDLDNHPAFPVHPSGATTKLKCREHGTEKDVGDGPITDLYMECHCRPVWPSGELTTEVDLVTRSPKCENKYAKYTHGLFENILTYAPLSPESVFMAAFIAIVSIPGHETLVEQFVTNLVTKSYQMAFWALDDYLHALTPALTEDDGKALGRALNKIITLFTSKTGEYREVRVKLMAVIEAIQRAPKNMRDVTCWGRVEYQAARDLCMNWFAKEELDEFFRAYVQDRERHERGFSTSERAHLEAMIEAFGYDELANVVFRADVPAELCTAEEREILSGAVYGSITATTVARRLSEQSSRAIIIAVQTFKGKPFDLSIVPKTVTPEAMAWIERIAGVGRHTAQGMAYFTERVPLGTAYAPANLYARFMTAGLSETRAQTALTWLAGFHINRPRELDENEQEWLKATRRIRTVVTTTRQAYDTLVQFRKAPSSCSPRVARAMSGWTAPRGDLTWQQYCLVLTPTYATVGANGSGRAHVMVSIKYGDLVSASTGYETFMDS